MCATGALHLCNTLTPWAAPFGHCPHFHTVTTRYPFCSSAPQKINSELEWARKLYNAHPEWPVIDVTLRGIEETAARILKLLNDRRGTTSPQWVDAIHAKSAAPPAAGAGPGAAAAQGGATARGPVDGEVVPGAPASIPELIYGAMSESSFMMQGLY